MVTDQFGTLIQELAKALGYNISVDVEDSCALPLPNGMVVQMEIADQQEFFIMAAEVGNVPIGRYRENIFREAMLYNGLTERVGTFAYSEIDDVMMLFREMPLQNLNGEKIAMALIPLSKKASTWNKAITQGEMPPAETTSATEGGDIESLMNLKP